jgi:hypothetical protein
MVAEDKEDLAYYTSRSQADDIYDMYHCRHGVHGTATVVPRH